MKCYASAVIKLAQLEIGYLEKASNKDLDSKTSNAGKNNYTKYARDLDAIPGFYNGKKQGYAWCDVFVDYLFVKAFGVDDAKRLLCQPDKSCGAGCEWSRNYYKSKGQLHTSPKAGDQIFFYNSSKTGIAHTGLVCKVDNTYVYTIEGNTSSASGVVANGGCVAEKKYRLNYKLIAGYGRPAYDEEHAASGATKPASVKSAAVQEWQEAAIKDGFDFPKYGADGEWGGECEAVAKKAIVKKRLTGYKYKNLTKIVQKALGVTVDGCCGKHTDAAIKTFQTKRGLTADGAVGLETWKAILEIK